MIANVEPLTPARALRGPFDYLLGESLDGVGVGSMLEVPFGARRLLGVVVEVAETSDLPPERLAEPLSALEADVPPELVRLGLWVAREYVSTPARGLALVLPPGTGTGAGRHMATRRSLTATITDEGRAALRERERLGSRQRAALEALVGAPARAGELARAGCCDHAGLRRLEARGLITLTDTAEAPRRPDLRPVGARGVASEPTAAQRDVLAAVLERMQARGSQDRRLLLHGVTGSGKTEVYMRAAAAALEAGRTAIVLVPEIALTPQTAGRFVERFGDTVAVLHSALTARERYDEWVRLRSGQARVCVGPRSAVFAPLTDVGLIVVDEEHDASYKQEGDPRYDARRVAERRAEAAGAVLLLGSATPRPESFARFRGSRSPSASTAERCRPSSWWAWRACPGRFTSAPARRSTRSAGRGRRRSCCSTAVAGPTSSPVRSCGRVWECPSCDVTLVLHRAAAPDVVPPLRPRPSRSPAPVRTAARCPCRAMAWAPSSSAPSWSG